MWIYLILTARLQRYRLDIFLYIIVALLAASFCTSLQTWQYKWGRRIRAVCNYNLTTFCYFQNDLIFLESQGDHFLFEAKSLKSQFASLLIRNKIMREFPYINLIQRNPQLSHWPKQRRGIGKTLLPFIVFQLQSLPLRDFLFENRYILMFFLYL